MIRAGRAWSGARGRGGAIGAGSRSGPGGTPAHRPGERRLGEIFLAQLRRCARVPPGQNTWGRGRVIGRGHRADTLAPPGGILEAQRVPAVTWMSSATGDADARSRASLGPGEFPVVMMQGTGTRAMRNPAKTGAVATRLGLMPGVGSRAHTCTEPDRGGGAGALRPGRGGLRASERASDVADYRDQRPRRQAVKSRARASRKNLPGLSRWASSGQDLGPGAGGVPTGREVRRETSQWPGLVDGPGLRGPAARVHVPNGGTGAGARG